MNEVIFLAHRNTNPKVTTDTVELLSCGTCHNKTWRAIYEASGEGFPRLVCAACGQDGGKFGWINPEGDNAA